MGLCESGDCPEVIRTSDVEVSDVVFNTIVVPAGSDLNDVLVLMETYFNDTLLDLESIMFTVVEPNCIGLAAGEYSYAQVIQAIITTLCDLSHTIDTLDTDTLLLGAEISIPSCLLPFAGSTSSDLYNAIMMALCDLSAKTILKVDPYDRTTTSNNQVPSFSVLADLHSGYADNPSYVYDHTTVTVSPTSLNINVNPIKAVILDNPIKIVATTPLTLTPNKDVYVTLDWVNGIEKIEQTIGNPDPILPSGKIFLYIIVTDASGVISYSEDFKTSPFIAPTFSIPNNYIQTAMIDALQVTGAKMETIGAGATEGHTSIIEITYDTKGRVTGATSLMSFSGLADGQILKYDSGTGGWINDNNLSVGTSGFVPLASGSDFTSSSIEDDGSQVTHALPVEINSGAKQTVAQSGLNVVSGTFMLPRYTAAAATVLAVFDGTVIYVTTTDATFTSVGVWAVENSTWTKL